jgi:anti-anti-sigma factor
MKEMEIVTVSKENYLIFEVSGRVDATSSPDFDAKFVEISNELPEPVSMIINMKNVEYMSSAGLRSVLKVAKYCASKQKKLILCQIQPAVLEVFKISGFTALLTITDTLDGAEAAIVK